MIFPDFDNYFQLVSQTGKLFLKMRPNRGISTGAFDSIPTADEKNRGVLLRTEGSGATADTFAIQFYDGSTYRTYYPALSVSSNLTYTDGISFIINGNGVAIGTGVAGELVIPYAFTISEAIIVGKPSGSIQVDIWADLITNATPDDSDSITASAPLVISSGVEATNTTLTGWSKTHPANTQLVFNVDSCATITKATIVLAVVRSL